MKQNISHRRDNAIKEIFGKKNILIGMVHCKPLPGSPKYNGEDIGEILESTLADARFLVENGFDGLIVENHGDIPFLKPDQIGHETTATLAVLVDRIRRVVDVPLGVNVLANAAVPALAVAKAAGASFIRVNQWANAYVANEGLVEGEAARALRYRAMIGAHRVAVFADAHVKHGAHAIVADRSIPELVRDVEFFDADAVIATGQRTGDSATLEEIDTIRGATRLPVLVGSGVTEDNVGDILTRVDGVIVASSLKHDGVWWNPVDPKRVRAFVAAAKEALG